MMAGVPPLSSVVTEADLKAREVVPFQAQVFADFVATIGRLFYDDGSIVLMDCLARAQRALSTNELRDKLKWRENLLHQKLYTLEKQLLLERVCDLERSTSTRALSGNQRWRIHCHLFVAVEWRYNALIRGLQKEVRRAAIRDDFECSNPNCKAKVDLIDAASGPKSLEDEHPLCRLCGSHLTTARSEEAKVKAEGLYKRACAQLAKLKENLLRVKGMEIPAFTASGVDTECGKLSNSPSSSTESSVVTQQPIKNEGAGTTASSANRVIPWFSSNGVATSATNPDRIQELLPNNSRFSTSTRTQSAASGGPSGSKSMTFGTSSATGSSPFLSGGGGLNGAGVLRGSGSLVTSGNSLGSFGGSQVNGNTAYSGNESESSSRSAASSGGRGWDGASSGSLASQAGRSPLKLTFGSAISSATASVRSVSSRMSADQQRTLTAAVNSRGAASSSSSASSLRGAASTANSGSRKLLKLNFQPTSAAAK